MNSESQAIDEIALLEQMLLVRAYEEAIVAGSVAGKILEAAPRSARKPPASASSAPFMAMT